MRKKILAFIFAVLFVAVSACGCGDKVKENDPEESEIFSLTKEILPEYAIIIPTDCDDDTKDVVTRLKSEIKSVTETEPEVRSDVVIEGSTLYLEAEYEILLGKTDRKETDDFYCDIRAEDAGYALVGKKILLLGQTAATLNSSCTMFVNDILSGADTKGVLMRSGERKIVAGTYAYNQMKLNDVDIQNYRIIYPAISSLQEKKAALLAVEYIKSKTGYVLNCESDRAEASPYEIQIGRTNRITDDMLSQRNAASSDENSCWVVSTGNGVWISGDTVQTLRSAVNKFYNLFEVKEGVAVLNITSTVSDRANMISVSALTYNVYHKFTAERNPDHVLQSIREQNTDIFGCNEANEEWMTRLTAEFKGNYSCVKGKNSKSDGSGDYCPVFFKTAKFELVESGTKWMSDTPDKVSKYNESHTQRIFTYAVLKDKTTGARFLYIQVHFENNESGYDSATARKKQSIVLKKFTDEYSLYPIIVGGDCNTTSIADLSPFLSNSRFVNASSVAAEKIESGTWVGSSFDAITGGVLDYFFITNDSIRITKYEAVDNKIGGKYPSDHIPVRINAVIYQ